MTFAWNVSKYIIAELGFFGVLASLFPIEIQSSILLGGTAQGKEKEPDKIFTFTHTFQPSKSLIKSLLEQNEDLQRELANSDQMNSDSQNIKDSKKEKASKKKKSSIYRSMRDPFQGKFFLGIIGIGCIKNLDTKPDRTRDLLGNGKI
ncbi:hypothetical protein ACJX0J_003864 (mitochondrion) [Zea mays]